MLRSVGDVRFDSSAMAPVIWATVLPSRSVAEIVAIAGGGKDRCAALVLTSQTAFAG